MQYYISFDENGLKSGTSWSVTVNGFTKSSTSSSIAFMEQNHGSYSYSISSVSDYRGPNPQSGSVYINGGSRTITVTYTSASPPSLGYMYVGCWSPALDNQYTRNLSQAIYNLSQTHTKDRYCMIIGGYSKLNFSIPYENANSGNSNWGITLYINNNGAWDQIYSTTNVNGNGILHYSWTTKPGIYDGFKVVFTNEYGTTTSVYNEQFDVYTGLVSNNSMAPNNPCISDSSAVSYYNSSGNIIGYLMITASINANNCLNPDYNANMGLQMSFLSIADNVSTSKFTYGIFNYSQSFNYAGSQNGNTAKTTLIPVNSAAQASSTNQQTSNTCCQIAEMSVYSLIENGLLLTDYGIVAGLAMAALGPIIFHSETGGSSGYWRYLQDKNNNYTFYNWDNNASSNCPPQIKCPIGYVVSGCSQTPVCPPVFTVVNNGNGEPSYVQNLNIKFETGIGLGTPTQRALDWYDYTAKATIVPISHCYIYNAGMANSKSFKFAKNDYVNATWHSTSVACEPWTWGSGKFEYNGPAYSIATPWLTIYFGVEG